MRTSSRSVALLLFDEVELFDVGGALGVLTAAGRQWNWRPFKVHAVAPRPGSVHTRSQIQFEAAAALDSCLAPEILLVPGGYGARRMLSDDRTMAWVSRAGRSAEKCIGIGNGVLVLARAGLCDGLDVAANRETAELLVELSPTARHNGTARFVEDGKLLTASTAGGGVEAALHLVAALLGKKQAQSVAASLGVTWLEGDAGGVEIVERSSVRDGNAGDG